MSQSSSNKKDTIFVALAIVVVSTLVVFFIVVVFFIATSNFKTVAPFKTINLNAPSEGLKIVYSKNSIEFTFSLTDIKDVLDKDGVLDEDDDKGKIISSYEEIVNRDQNGSESSPPLSFNERFIEDFLLNGKVKIYDEEEQIEYKQIIYREFEYYCGTACGAAGIQFIATKNNKIIYQLEKWVS